MLIRRVLVNICAACCEELTILDSSAPPINMSYHDTLGHVLATCACCKKVVNSPEGLRKEIESLRMKLIELLTDKPVVEADRGQAAEIVNTSQQISALTDALSVLVTSSSEGSPL